MAVPSKQEIVNAFRSKGYATYPYAIEVNGNEAMVRFHKLGNGGTSMDDEEKLEAVANMLGAKGAQVHKVEGMVTLWWAKEKLNEDTGDEAGGWEVDGEGATVLVDFILNTPDIDDEKFHAFAEEQGIDTHEAETAVYRVFQQLMLDLAAEEETESDPAAVGQDMIDVDQITEGKELEAADRLAEIKDEIKELMKEAMEIVKEATNWGSEMDRARSYWYAHIVSALDSDHEYLGGSMHTMQDTIDFLSDEGEEEPE